MHKMGITQKFEAQGMYSADGEYVEFGHPVLLEGPVEVNLCTVGWMNGIQTKSVYENVLLM